jgi:hypothetical protein
MSKETNNFKIGVFGFMFLIMFAAKVFGLIDWSWWLVFSPLWAPIALVLLFWIVCLILDVIEKHF